MNNMKIQKDTSELFEGYRVKLFIPKEDSKALLSARREIRFYLQKRLSVNNSPVKFLTQGSSEYKTINRPCYPPIQQMDLDYGVYIPDYVAKDREPAEWLDYVEDCLKPLAESKGWTFTRKSSCVRVELGKDANKHIDIPFYCISEDDIANLLENIPPTVSATPDEFEEFRAGMSYRKYKGIDPNNVQMAHRNEGWKKSDPRKIIEWVVSRVDERGDKYIHICRILKGWRDNQWKDNSPLTSIMIMVMVEMAMKEACISRRSSEREDEALFEVVDVIIEKILCGDIPDPDNAESLNSKWDRDQKDDCVLKFNSLQKALYGDSDSNNDAYIRKLREEFGKFFPTDNSFIKPCKPVVTTVVAAATTAATANTRPYAASMQDDFSSWNIGRTLRSWKPIKNLILIIKGIILIKKSISIFWGDDE